MAPTKVIISVNTSWNIYNFRKPLIREFNRREFDVVALSPADAHTPNLGKIGCRHLPLPMDNKGTSPAVDLGLFVRFLRLLRRERPNIFLGFTIKPNIYGSLAAHVLGIPVINNISGLGTAFLSKGWLNHLVKLFYRVSLRSSAVVFFQNEDDRNLFLQHKLIRPAQARLLPGSGVDLEAYRPTEKPRHTTFPTRFLLIARLLWDKGVGEFVEAARIVKAHFPEAQFQLLGFLDAENRTAISRATVDQWVSEGIVDYLGVADDVRPFISDCDCVVLPSYREGTPRTLLEAAAMGKPMIATDVPGCREVVDDGVNGYLCEVRNSEDLAQKIIDFIGLSRDERMRMGSASRAKVVNEFDEKIVVARYLSAIESILEQRDGAGP